MKHMKRSLSLKLDEDLLAEVDALTSDEVSRSQVIRELLRYGLAAHSAKGSLVIPKPWQETVAEAIQGDPGYTKDIHSPPAEPVQRLLREEVEPRFK